MLSYIHSFIFFSCRWKMNSKFIFYRRGLLPPRFHFHDAKKAIVQEWALQELQLQPCIRWATLWLCSELVHLTKRSTFSWAPLFFTLKSETSIRDKIIVILLLIYVCLFISALFQDRFKAASCMNIWSICRSSPI